MFAANKATDGGAIYNTGALNLNGQLSFIGNSALYDNGEDDAKGFGGAIYNTGMLDIYGTNVKFSNNTAQKAGGAIYNNGGVVNISGSGILFNNNKVLEADNVDFVNWKNDAKKGFGGEVIFFDKIVNKGTDAGANLTLELNKSNVLNATSPQLEQMYAKFFDAGGAYIGPNSKPEMQKTILGANSVYWLSKEEAAAAGRLK